MSKYTTQVRFICETAAGLTESVGFNDVNRIIQDAIPKVFNFDFPMYDESYRNVLCTKILKHYYTREIGAETVGLWKLWLDARLNEIMPYYNQLYKSAMIEFNPMYDIDLTTTHHRDNDGTTDVTGNNTNTHEGTSKVNDTSNNNNTTRDAYSDTPQGALDNVENMTYLTNARKVTNEGNSTGESSSEFSGTNNAENTAKTVAKSTEDYLQTIQGKSGGTSYSKRLQEFRSTFLNIDAMIIDELKDLFMNLW